MAQLRAYLKAEAEDTISIAPDVDSACIERLRAQYSLLGQSLARARGDDTAEVADAMRIYLMRAGCIAVSAVGLQLAGTVDLTQPQLWFVCLALMMLAAYGLDAAPLPTV